MENFNPEQLSSTLSAPELNDQKLQKLAMKTYLEARQREDIREDLASRLMPSDGPFSVGEHVYYWQVDPNKIKHGVADGLKERLLARKVPYALSILAPPLFE